MFERFTDKARAVVILARAKATERGDQIRPVYMLYALASAEGVAARVLASLGVDADSVEGLFDRTAPLRSPLEGEAPSEDAEALAAIGIDLEEIKRRIEESFGPGALARTGALAHQAHLHRHRAPAARPAEHGRTQLARRIHPRYAPRAGHRSGSGQAARARRTAARLGMNPGPRARVGTYFCDRSS
jgi:hypothetical protein